MAGIFYYVSGHGYGHAVRSAQVISAILERSPEIEDKVMSARNARLSPEDEL